jgi:serine/threonine-protein kinase RsbW
VEEKQIKISIPSKIEFIDEAVVKTVEFAKDSGFAEDDIFGIDMAVREAVANAVKHGNKLDESKDVEIDLTNSEETFQIKIRDFGDGFSVEEVPDPTNPENLMKADGRGILFMQNFIDVVEWHNHPEGGMLVKMVKKH